MMGLLRGWSQGPLGALMFYRVWLNVPAASVRNEAGWGFVHQGAVPEPGKKGAPSTDCRAMHARPLFLAGGGLSSGGGLVVVGDLFAGMRPFGCGSIPDRSGIVPGHFGDEGLQGVVAA